MANAWNNACKIILVQFETNQILAEQSTTKYYIYYLSCNKILNNFTIKITETL